MTKKWWFWLIVIVIACAIGYFSYVHFTKKSLVGKITDKCGKNPGWEGEPEGLMKMNICQLKKLLNNCSASVTDLEVCGKLPFKS